MRLRIRLAKLLFWTTLLVLCTLAGALGFAYSYYTDSATLRPLIKAELLRYLPTAQVDLGTVRVRPLIGEVKLTHMILRQVIGGANFQTLVVPWLHVRVDPRAVLKGKFDPQEVILAHPTLRLCQRPDGTWNVQGLLADPWPGPAMKQTPPVVIQNGTIELVEVGGPAAGSELAVLREASIRVESAEGRVLKFDGTAKGEVFDHVKLAGTFNLDTGQVRFDGDLTRLVASDKLFQRLPPRVREAVAKLGLNAGELDVDFQHVAYDPGSQKPLSYELAGRLRGGVWSCPKLPFPINDLTAAVLVRDGALEIKHLRGANGTTTVRGRGSVALAVVPDPALDLHIEIGDLELDERLRKWLPAEFGETWDDFQPRGRVNLEIGVRRPAAGAKLALETHAECLDVGMLYSYFKYPLDHVRGRVDWVGQRVTLDLGTFIGGKPLHVTGTIDDPGPNAVVKLDFAGPSLPIDKTLLDAIPPEIRTVIDDFQPSGSVRGTARFERKPPLGPNDDPRGRITIDAGLDLNERCSIRWVGLPYPIENLTGHLDLHPDRWAFKGMRGGNGQAVLTAEGEVRKVGVDAQGKDQLKVDLHMHAERLPFDQELRQSLPPAWQKTWPVLNPIGSSDVDARILVEPAKEPYYHVEIVPNPATSVRLKFERTRRSPADPGGAVEMRMEDVSGRFVFDNGNVHMTDVGFRFREAPVQFVKGDLQVKDNGSFQLAVSDLWAREFRFDAGLREKMPPLMAQFARRLEGDGQTFEFTGNLGLNWSGASDQPVHCLWNSVRVVLNNNSIDAGLPLKNVNGVLYEVGGSSDGTALEVHGKLSLDSVFLLDQQVTRVNTEFHVANGLARIDKIRGELLGGAIAGNAGISLDATPRYAANLAVRGADLQKYARSIPQRQSYRGLVSADLEFKGMGNDLHTLEGRGEAHVTEGNLGELPSFLTLMKALTLSPVNRSAFDSADVYFTIRNGESYLDPIRFTGNAFSLLGRGTLDVQGGLDLRLRMLYGRDRMHLAVLSDALREASGQFLVVRVRGTPAYPDIKLETLPGARAFAERRAAERVEPVEPQGERRRFNLPFRP